MSGKSSPEFQWTDYEIQLPLLAATQNLNVEERYKKIARFYLPDQRNSTVIYVLLFLPAVVVSFYRKLLFLYQTTLLNLH